MPSQAWVASLLALSGLSCTRLNPGYDESVSDGSSAGGNPASSTSSPSSTTSSTADSGDSAPPKPTSSTSLDTTGAPPPPPALIEFVDESWDGEFAEAESLQNVGWLDEGVQILDASVQGTLESRIFDAGSQTQWLELRWDPRGPYGTPIHFPIDEATQSYPAGNTSVHALEFLAHLDAGPFANNDPVEDATGLRDAVWVGATTDDVRGIFGRGLRHEENNNTDAFRIDVDSAIEPGTGPFTWTVWYRSNTCTDMNMLALDSTVDSPLTGLYFMACGGVDTFCLDGDPNHAVAYLQGPDQALVRVCSDVTIDDDQWHHIALRRQVVGPESQVTEIFVDGRPAGGGPQPIVTDVSVHPAAPTPENFTLAGGNAGMHSGAGAYDEFALWNRALDDAELENLYLRGMLLARFQLRACDDPDCSDRDFRGPSEGDPSSVYIDPGPQLGHAIDLSGLELRSRYVQYRFLLERPESARSPSIDAVVVTGIQE